MTKKVQIMLNRMDRAVEHWFLPIIGNQEGRLMARLVKAQKPKRAVEVGVLIGYSTIIIAANLPPRGRLTSLEVSSFLAYITGRNVAEADRLRDRRGCAPSLFFRFEAIGYQAYQPTPLLASSPFRASGPSPIGIPGTPYPFHLAAPPPKKYVWCPRNTRRNKSSQLVSSCAPK